MTQVRAMRRPKLSCRVRVWGVWKNVFFGRRANRMCVHVNKRFSVVHFDFVFVFDTSAAPPHALSRNPMASLTSATVFSATSFAASAPRASTPSRYPGSSMISRYRL